jgi:hypothetical protein
MIKAEKQQVPGTMNAKVNNIIYMELYSGAKMVDDKYEKTNVAGSIDREFTVQSIGYYWGGGGGGAVLLIKFSYLHLTQPNGL